MSNLNHTLEAEAAAGIAFNKRLIAEAPAMLEALKRLLQYPDMGTAIHPGCLDWEDVRAILARLDAK